MRLFRIFLLLVTMGFIPQMASAQTYFSGNGIVHTTVITIVDQYPPYRIDISITLGVLKNNACTNLSTINEPPLLTQQKKVLIYIASGLDKKYSCVHLNYTFKNAHIDDYFIIKQQSVYFSGLRYGVPYQRSITLS